MQEGTTPDTLSWAACYQALQSRDSRFDGRFFTAVKTTGVYCRPICPARTPHLENVEFYPCAAAAEQAGFRPCLRCRPEAAPGTPAWQGTQTTVVRALKMLEQGALEREGVDHFAERLGVTARHLRRLFRQHLGVSPLALARTRRLHLARTLLHHTSLPISQVALAAGFSSLRRFNQAFRRAYGSTPTGLRKEGATPGQARRPLRLSLQLSYRAPYHFEAMLDFLGKRCIPGVECVEAGSYARTISINDEAGLIRVSRSSRTDTLDLVVEGDVVSGLDRIVGRVRRLFDLDADPEPIRRQLGKDSRLSPLLKRWPGLRLPGCWSGFELGVRAILGQQISLGAASTLAGRLAHRFGTPIDLEGSENCSFLFPRAERLARADLSDLGLPAGRGETIRRLARLVAEGNIDLDVSDGLESTISRLTEIRGIGPWTAHYIAMRALGEPDAFPSGDLVLRRRMGAAKGDAPSPSRLDHRSQAWRPWRAYAAMYLWRDNVSSRSGAGHD